MSEFNSVGSAYLSESDKIKHRAVALGFTLILLHLLDLKASEVSAFGVKTSIDDPIIIYFAASMVFYYYLFRFISLADKGETFFPLERVKRSRKLKATLRSAIQVHRSSKKGRKNPQTPAQLKMSAKNLIQTENILLFPYRCAMVTIVTVAVILAFVDILEFYDYITRKYNFIEMIVSLF